MRVPEVECLQGESLGPGILIIQGCVDRAQATIRVSGDEFGARSREILNADFAVDVKEGLRGVRGLGQRAGQRGIVSPYADEAVTEKRHSLTIEGITGARKPRGKADRPV